MTFTTASILGTHVEVGADGFASLVDGVYDFALDATKVHPDGISGINMAANSTTTFDRLFGDTGLPDFAANGGCRTPFALVGL